MRYHFVLVAGALLLIVGSTAQAQPSATGGTVSREDYDKLKTRLDRVEQQMAEQKKQPAITQEDVDKIVEEVEKDIKTNRDMTKDLSLGSTNFFLTGYGAAGYTDRRKENSNFSASFNPIFLWKLNDRLFFEGELELELEGGQTSTKLEYANMSYVLNDYMIVGAGKFLLPFGVFNPKLHPAWINRLPDRPLPYSDAVGIAPESDIGAFLRGAAPIGSTRINYAIYVANGPALTTDSMDDAGKLNFDNTNDNNHNKAVGGRVGWLPIPELEVGYSIQFAQVNPSGFEDTNALLQAVDVSYRRDIDQIGGTIDLRCEWVWSQVDKATYDPSGALGFGPVTFSNNRNAGYAQVSYRPTKMDNKFLRSLEFVCRFDMLDVPSRAPGSFDEKRWAFGIDYWVTPSFVVKTAYEVDDRKGAPDQNAFFLQGAMGF